MNVTSTENWADALAVQWDVIVVGAGPAGIAAAMESHRLGLRTLLLDKNRFPRDKVCGGCMNQVALAQLSALGCGELPRQLGAVPLLRFVLGVQGREVALHLPGGMALSRVVFDNGLLATALSRGLPFMQEVIVRDGSVGDGVRQLHIRRGHEQGTLSARWVVAADGLGGRYTASLAGCIPETRPAAYMGLSTELEDGSAYAAGTIHMASHGKAYVGLVRLENNHLHLAAAAHPDLIRQAGSPSSVLRTVLQGVGWPVPSDLNAGVFHGTPHLTTRHRPVALERVFLVGDAAGYIEPFTGEGIAWALMGGCAVAGLLPEAVSTADWQLPVRDWNRTYTNLLGRRQRICQWMTRSLRHPKLTDWLVSGLTRIPGLADPLIQAINTPQTSQSLRGTFHPGSKTDTP